MTTDINAIYLRHMDALQLISDTHKHIHSSTMGLSLHLALAELDAAWREMATAQPAADIVEEHRHLDATVRRIERVLEAHDSAVYADLVAGNIELPTAIDAVIDSYKAALAAVAADTQRSNARQEQLNRIGDWIRIYDGDTYDGDTADAIIAVADTLRGQVAKLRVEVGDLRLTVSQLHEHRRANQPLITEVNALRQQLAQMDADNARLTQELRTVRSWSVAPTGNGKSHPAAEMLVERVVKAL